jgi:hypothetical protein
VLAVIPKQSLVKRIAVNQLGASAVVGFTAYMTGCIMIWGEDSEEFTKAELLVDLYGVAYVTWKWYMGLGPEPPIHTGITEDDQCRRLR